MIATPDIKSLLADGWEVVFPAGSRGERVSETGYARAVLHRSIPGEHYDPRLVGDEFQVYGSNRAGREYRFPRVQITDARRVQSGAVNYIARPVVPFYPATPFDPFLIGIEAGDPGAAAALIDHLTELHGEGRIHFRTDTHLPYLQLCAMDGQPDSLARIAKGVISEFGGSRQLQAPELTRHAP